MGAHPGSSGRAGIADLAIDDVVIYLGDHLIAVNGGVSSQYSEAAGQEEMNKSDILIRIKLGRGNAAETVWTSDLSHDYVSINADYRS